MFTSVMLNTLVNYQHVSKGLTWAVFVPSHNGETHGRVLERASREQLVSAHLEGEGEYFSAPLGHPGLNYNV